MSYSFQFLFSQKKSRNQFAALEQLNNDMDMEDIDDIGDEFIELSEEMAGMYIDRRYIKMFSINSEMCESLIWNDGQSKPTEDTIKELALCQGVDRVPRIRCTKMHCNISKDHLSIFTKKLSLEFHVKLKSQIPQKKHTTNEPYHEKTGFLHIRK